MNAPGGPIGNELDIRSLRYFVAAAEELNFTRAAARLYVAQQALSREIQRLEARLGVKLFVRTTRRVSLTPEGQLLLERARDLVARHDALWADIQGPAGQPTVVDLMSEGRLHGSPGPSSWLESAARASTSGGATRAAPVRPWRTCWRAASTSSWDGSIGSVRRRCRRSAGSSSGSNRSRSLLPSDHPMARLEAVPVRSLDGMEIDGLPTNAGTPEWTDLVAQFLALSGARSTPPHLPAIGLEEQGYHLVRQGLPILTSADSIAVPGGVLRPLVEPVPVVRLVDRPGGATLGTADRQPSGMPRPSSRPSTGGWRGIRPPPRGSRSRTRRSWPMAPASSSRAAARSNTVRDRLHQAHRQVVDPPAPSSVGSVSGSVAPAWPPAQVEQGHRRRGQVFRDEAPGHGDR